MTIRASLSETVIANINAEFLTKLDNLIDTGLVQSPDPAPISNEISFRSILAGVSSWVKSHFSSITALDKASQISSFIREEGFSYNLNWLSPEEQIGTIAKLQRIVLEEQKVIGDKILEITDKQKRFANSWSITKWFYSIPSEEELSQYEDVDIKLNEAQRILSATHQTATLLIEQIAQEAHQREIEAEPVPVQLLESVKPVEINSPNHPHRQVTPALEALLSADGHFISSQVNPTAFLRYSKLSTIPFIAMVRELETNGTLLGPKFAAPIREELTKLGVTPEEFQGYLDQTEIKKFNQACLNYLEQKFGHALVQPLRDCYELRPYLQGKRDIFGETTYSVMTGIAFHRLAMQLQIEKNALEEKMARERAAIRAKAIEAEIHVELPMEEIPLNSDELPEEKVQPEIAIVETRHKFPNIMELVPSQSITQLGSFVSRQLAGIHSAPLARTVSVEKVDETDSEDSLSDPGEEGTWLSSQQPLTERPRSLATIENVDAMEIDTIEPAPLKKSWLPSDPMAEVKSFASKMKMPNMRRFVPTDSMNKFGSFVRSSLH